jgi:hypothetical protein
MRTGIAFPGRLLSLGLGMALLCLLSACSFLGLGGAQQGVTQSQTPAQVLQNAATAMQHLKSAHITMNVGTTANGGNTAGQQQNNTLTVRADGDQVFPGQSSLRMSIGPMTGGTPTIFTEVVTGNQLYVQNSQGQWHVISEQNLAGSPFSAIQVSNYNNLLMLAQKATLTDHGEEMLNGQTTRHITMTFNSDALKSLLSATGQLGSLSTQQQQDLNQELSQIKLNASTLDVWIDTTNSYVSRMELRFSISSAANSNGSTNETSSVDATIDYSKYNESVTISAPAGAIPVNNAGDLL